MHIIHSFEKLSPTNLKTVLTIGNFDGFHLGHKTLIDLLIQKGKEISGRSAVLTFSNHPSKILHPSNPKPLLCTIEHKIHLLQSTSLDLIICLPFTELIAAQSAEFFLRFIQQHISLHTLLLGSDAHLGKNKEGDRRTITQLAKTLKFDVHYLPDYKKNEQRISSSLIRNCIEKGNFKEAEWMLGRPYSIYQKVIRGSGKGKALGFPTANLSVDQLCLPPFGVYAVYLRFKEDTYPAVANLGFAPTIRTNQQLFLEIHLLDQTVNLGDEWIEVFFCEYIRSEKRFENLDALKNQISLDIHKARQILRSIPIPS